MTADTPARAPSDAAGQTDPREVERMTEIIQDLHRVADGMTVNDGRVLASRAADTIAALREKLEAAERRAYDLAVAIMGGEDAPGYADSIPAEQLVEQQRKMAAEWADDLVRAGKQRREAEAALTTARAERDAAWLAGRDAFTALLLADQALDEAEGILGGEYGGLYGPLCAQIGDLRHRINQITPPADPTAALEEHTRRAVNETLERAAAEVEQAPGSITDRQELASRIRRGRVIGDPA